MVGLCAITPLFQVTSEKIYLYHAIGHGLLLINPRRSGSILAARCMPPRPPMGPWTGARRRDEGSGKNDGIQSKRGHHAASPAGQGLARRRAIRKPRTMQRDR